MSASKTRSVRRRPHLAGLRVEGLEGRALLTVAASTLHAEATSLITAEVTTLTGNITTIKTATTNFIAAANADIKYRLSDEAANKGNAAQDKKDIAYDKLLIKNAGRDEKFAIGQQSGIIKSLQHSQIVYNRMKTPNLTALEGDIAGANVKGTSDLNGLLGTYAAGKA